MVRPDVPNHQISLKSNLSEPTPESATEEPSIEDPGAMQVDSSATIGPSVASEVLETVVHYMLGELMRVDKLASDGLSVETPKEGTNASSGAPSSQSTGPERRPQPAAASDSATVTQKTEDNQKAQDAHYYACFLMQSLSELLFSYEQCKLALSNER